MVIGAGFLFLGLLANAQKVSDILPRDATVQGCVQYALNHYPLIQQALLDEQIYALLTQLTGNLGCREDKVTPHSHDIYSISIGSFTPGTRLRCQLSR